MATALCIHTGRWWYDILAFRSERETGGNEFRGANLIEVSWRVQGRTANIVNCWWSRTNGHVCCLCKLKCKLEGFRERMKDTRMQKIPWTRGQSKWLFLSASCKPVQSNGKKWLFFSASLRIEIQFLKFLASIHVQSNGKKRGIYENMHVSAIPVQTSDWTLGSCWINFSKRTRGTIPDTSIHWWIAVRRDLMPKGSGGYESMMPWNLAAWRGIQTASKWNLPYMGLEKGCQFQSSWKDTTALWNRNQGTS